MHEQHADQHVQATRTPFRPRAMAGALSRPVAAVLIGAALLGLGWWHYRDPGNTGQTHAGDGAPPSGGGNGPGARRFGGAGGKQAVSVQAARKQDVRVTASAIGNLTAANTAVVHVQVSGILQSINFREGQQVQAGQLLAQIDPRAFQAQVAQAEGALARDRAQLDNARVDLARYQDLLAKDAVPKQQLDTQQALVRQLEGTVQVDRASLDSARLQLTYTRVVAPIAGRVGLKQADLGNVVQPGDANGIVSITQTHPIALVFAVPSTLLPQIVRKQRNHQPMAVRALDKISGSTIATGLVSSIDNAIDATTDSIRLKALFPNQDDSLFPNQSVSVILELDTLKDTLCVPQAAVLRGAQGFYVYVANADGTVNTRVVQTGAVDNGWMAVTGDLQAGQNIVVDGVDRLRDGAKVDIITPGGPGAGGAGRKQGGAVRPDGAGAQGGASAAVHANAGAAAGTAPPAADAPAASGNPGDGDRRAFFQSLTPEEREKFKSMTPEQKQVWRQTGHAPTTP